MLKKIRMLGSGPNGNHKPGAVLLVDEQRAAVLIKGKHAEAYKAGKAVKDGDKMGSQGLQDI